MENTVTTIDTDADQPVPQQLAPQYSESYFKDKGFTDADISNVYEAINYQAPEDAPDYKLDPNSNLMKDTKDRPMLPVEAIPETDGSANIRTVGYLRPAQAWRAIDLEPPTWSRGPKNRYIPWPILGEYGHLLPGKRLCHISNIEMVRKLNEKKINTKMNVVNRADRLKINDRSIRIPRPAENILESTETVPLQVTGTKAGPKMPVPVIPDADTQWSPLFSQEAATNLTNFKTQELIENIEGSSQPLFDTPPRKKAKPSDR